MKSKHNNGTLIASIVLPPRLRPINQTNGPASCSVRFEQVWDPPNLASPPIPTKGNVWVCPWTIYAAKDTDRRFSGKQKSILSFLDSSFT
ncbi:hypothetical protein QR680_012307 [Steinernema hermaphroditum]|uniref:Uncharacterized protein n=1 Tax=Steinernema hermaphroditum TaxID=289476 RepID=A0AA39M0B3_9BILA|nr:hypothetical protein QR680_012307 [Steinernema hermaphroditum]